MFEVVLENGEIVQVYSVTRDDHWEPMFLVWRERVQAWAWVESGDCRPAKAADWTRRE